jgi:hypothetical protein
MPSCDAIACLAALFAFGLRCPLRKLQTFARLFPFLHIDTLLLQFRFIRFEIAALCFALERHRKLSSISGEAFSAAEVAGAADVAVNLRMATGRQGEFEAAVVGEALFSKDL